jgi:hypothetical protein
VNKAAAGDSRSLQTLLGTLRQMEQPQAPARIRIENEADLRVINQVVARIGAIITSGGEQ